MFVCLYLFMILFKIVDYGVVDYFLRFVGEGRSQYRNVMEEDPGEVKEVAEKLEKLETPDPDDAGYVKLQLMM